MRIVRLDEKTVKCFLSNEELKEYELEYSDFITRSEKARELVHEIMKKANEEVGYEPPQFALEMQIMVVPEQGVVLTFADKDADGSTISGQFADYLKELKEMFQSTKDELLKSKDKAVEASAPVGKPVAAAPKPGLAVFCFASVGRVMDYAAVLPANLRVESSLYKQGEFFFLLMAKGGASFKRFGMACIQALEFGSLYSAEEQVAVSLKEHSECLIAEKALKVLARSQRDSENL